MEVRTPEILVELNSSKKALPVFFVLTDFLTLLLQSKKNKKPNDPAASRSFATSLKGNLDFFRII